MPAGGPVTRRRLLLGAGALGLAGLGLGGLGGAAAGLGLVVTRHAVRPEGWRGGPRLRVAALADLHAGWPFMGLERVEAIVAATNALAPDLVVLLGDYGGARKVALRPVAPADWARALARLRAPLGVHAILGNHDYWDDPEVQARRAGTPLAARALMDAGVPVLVNEAVPLAKDGRRFALAGLGDQLAYWVGWGRFRSLADLDGTLARAGPDPVLLLMHEPDLFPRVGDRAALTLAGHTHGGQVRVLGYSPVVPSRHGNRYAYGHVVEGGRHLVVSGGLGVSAPPVRIGVPPEIVLVDLAGPEVPPDAPPNTLPAA